MLKRLLLIVIFLGTFIQEKSYSQDNYPVSCTPLFYQSPHQLSDMVSTGNFKVNLLLKDLTKGSVQVYLRIRLSSLGIDIGNPAGFRPSKLITLEPGKLETLSGADLLEYFNPNNLVSQGINTETLFQGGTLPQGLWTVTVEAYEAFRDRQVSNQGQALTSVFLAPPPFLISPINDKVVDETQPQQVWFQWQPSGAQLGQNGLVTYTLKVWKVSTEPNADRSRPDSVVTYTGILGNTQFMGADAALQLVAGERYAWDITVEDQSGGTYSNQGRSQVGTFIYGGTCKSPVLNMPLLGAVSNTWSVNWSNVPSADHYVVSYAKEGEAIKTQSTYTTSYTIPEVLDPTATYHISVQAVCSGNRNSDPSNVMNVLGQTATDPTAPPTLTAFTATATTNTNATPEDDLSSVLNPYANPIRVSINGEVLPPLTMEEMLTQLKTMPPPDCGQAYNNGASCTESKITKYDGSEELVPQAGDLLAINGFKAICTGDGKGLLFWDFGGGIPVPVIFKDIKAWKAQTPSKGGCVYAGEMVVEGSDNSVLDRDVQSRLNALMAKMNDPTSFAGSFKEALEATKTQAQAIIAKIASGQQPTAEEIKKYKTVCKAVQVGIDGWKSDIVKKIPAPVPPEVTTVLDSLEIFKGQLQDMLNCSGTGYLHYGIENGALYASNGTIDAGFYFVGCDYAKGKEAALGVERMVDALHFFTAKSIKECISKAKLSVPSDPITFLSKGGHPITISNYNQVVLDDNGKLEVWSVANSDDFYQYDAAAKGYTNGSTVYKSLATQDYIFVGQGKDPTFKMMYFKKDGLTFPISSIPKGAMACNYDQSEAKKFNELTKKEELTAEEIATYRTFISKLPQADQSKWYLELQKHVPYHSQLDNASACGGAIMCNLTSLAMNLEALGVSNPTDKQQFEDWLETQRLDNFKNIYRGDATAWKKLAAFFNVNTSGSLPLYNSSKDFLISKIKPELEKGNSISLSIYPPCKGHIVRVQGITDEGLIIDDPNGWCPIACIKDRQNCKTGYDKGTRNSVKAGAGDNNLYTWSDLAQMTIKYMVVFSK